MLRWALKSARRADAFHDVEEAILALVAVAVKSPSDPDGVAFKAQFAAALQADQIPVAGLLQGAAQGLRRCIEDYNQNLLKTRQWDYIIKASNPEQRSELLTDLATMLEEAAAR